MWSSYAKNCGILFAAMFGGMLLADNFTLLGFFLCAIAGTMMEITYPTFSKESDE